MPTTVTLLQKAYGSFSPKMFQSMISSLCKGLKVEVKFQGESERSWVEVEVSGEDEAVTLQLLDHEMGLAPVSLDKVERFSTLRGRVVSSEKGETELFVDVGVSSPRVCDAAVSLERLRAQLADGKKLALPSLIKLYCLIDHMPLRVKIVDKGDVKDRLIEAELSESQLSQFSAWIRSSLDRLMVLGAWLRDVERAVEVSGHGRDVVRIESLGLLEHAVICKLGTDAVGLMPKLGPHVPTAALAPFSPRKIEQIIDRLFL